MPTSFEEALQTLAPYIEQPRYEKLTPKKKQAEVGKLAEETELGQWPGDEKSLDALSKAKTYPELNTLSRERRDVFGQVERARKQTSEINAADAAQEQTRQRSSPDFRDRAKTLGQDILKRFFPEPAAPDQAPVPTGVPTTSPPRQQPVQTPDSLGPPGPLPAAPPTSRFQVDEGEIVDTKAGQIIPFDRFEKVSTPQEKAEVMALMSAHHKYDFGAAKEAGVSQDPVTGHWDSRFKYDDNPRRFLPSESGIYDTKYNKLIPQQDFDRIATQEQKDEFSQNTPLPAAEVQGYLGGAAPAPAGSGMPPGPAAATPQIDPRTGQPIPVLKNEPTPLMGVERVPQIIREQGNKGITDALEGFASTLRHYQAHPEEVSPLNAIAMKVREYTGHTHKLDLVSPVADLMSSIANALRSSKAPLTPQSIPEKVTAGVVNMVTEQAPTVFLLRRMLGNMALGYATYGLIKGSMFEDEQGKPVFDGLNRQGAIDGIINLATIGILHGLAPTNRMIRAGAGFTVGAGTTAAQGGSTEDVVSNALMFGVAAGLPPGNPQFMRLWGEQWNKPKPPPGPPKDVTPKPPPAGVTGPTAEPPGPPPPAPTPKPAGVPTGVTPGVSAEPPKQAPVTPQIPPPSVQPPAPIVVPGPNAEAAEPPQPVAQMPQPQPMVGPPGPTPPIEEPKKQSLAPTVEDIHALADAKGIPYDNDKAFMDLTQKTTGKRHLDDLGPVGLQQMADVLKGMKGTPATGDFLARPEVSKPRSELAPADSEHVLLRAEKGKADLEIAQEDAPQSILGFLSDKGGMQDQGGELSHLGVDTDKKPFQKNLIRVNGMTLDQAAEAAHEAGLIPDRDINLLLDAMDQELRGHGPSAPAWYVDLTKGKGAMSKQAVETAIEKIIKDEGVDRGKAVERVKAALLEDPEFAKSPWGEEANAILSGEKAAPGQEPTFSLTAQGAAKVKPKGPEQMGIAIPPETIGTRPIIGREAQPEEAPLFSKAAQELPPNQQSLPGSGVSKMETVGEGGERRAVAGMDPRMMKVLGGNLYSGNLPHIAIKEMLQNAVDSVRGLPRDERKHGAVHVSVDTTKRMIRVVDNGTGMTPEVAVKELVDIGGSKKVEGASGGFGIAKVAIFANAESIKVETVAARPEGARVLTRLTGTGDDWLDHAKGLRVETEPTSLRTGTTMEIVLRKKEPGDESGGLEMYSSAIGKYLQDFIGNHRLPFEITANIDKEQKGVPDYMQAAGPLRRSATLTFPGGTADIYLSKEGKSKSFGDMTILNNGLPQFQQSYYLPEALHMPSRLIVDVHAAESPEEPNYPFTPDRERLRGPLLTELHNYVTTILARDAAKAEMDLYRKTMKESPVIPGTDFQVIDTGGTLDKALVKELAQSEHLEVLTQQIGEEFHAIQMLLSKGSPAVNRVEFAGIGLGNTYLGVNINGSMITGKDDAKNLILINPYTILAEVRQQVQYKFIDEEDVPGEMSRQIVATVVHELTHQQARGHGEDFAGHLTRNQGRSIVSAAASAESLHNLLGAAPKGGGLFDASVIDALTADLARLQPTWAKGEDIFGKISASHERPRESRNRRRAAAGSESAGRRSQENLSRRREGETGALESRPSLQRSLPGSRSLTSAERGSFPANIFIRPGPEPVAGTQSDDGRFHSHDPEVEARYQQATKGIGKETLLAKLKEFWDTFKRRSTRKYEYLPDTAEFAPLQFALDNLEKQKGISNELQMRALHEIVGTLSDPKMDLFTRKVILMDLTKEAEAGRLLPYGYTPESVARDLADVDQLLTLNPDVQTSFDQRQALWTDRKRRYSQAMDAIGFDVSKKITKDDYFRHQVLAYAQEIGTTKGTGERVRTPTGRSFLKQRVGSTYDINANYLQAEFEVLAQMDYDIHLAQVIKLVDDRYNIQPKLKEQARQANEAAFRAELQQQEQGGPLEEDWKHIRQMLAFHMGKLKQALHLEADETVPMAEINRLAADPTAEGHASALGVFKWINRRRALIKATLGDKFKTWEDVVPPTHAIFQPREGNIFYMADTLPHQMVQQLMERMGTQMGISAADLKKVLAMGGKREQFVIPEPVAQTLTEMKKPEYSLVQRTAAELQGMWKAGKLVGPHTVFKYNLRNLSGDAEAAFVGNPSSFKYAPRAVKDLLPVFMGRKTLTGPVKDWFERGGMGTLLQINEMGDVNDLTIFKHLQDRSEKRGLLSIPAKVFSKYWKTARLATDFREAILRYANYLDYLNQLENLGGLKNYGASIRATIDALEDPKDQAFKLSNELIGAYDRISVNGAHLRRYWMPFWSWKEVNFSRYKQLIKNAFHDRDYSGGARAAAFKSASTLLKLAFAYGALQIWNQLFFSEEEKDLNERTRNRVHIILPPGRTADGKITYLDGIGAIGDLLSWVGLDGAFSHLVSGDLLHDRMTLKELSIEMLKAPFNVLTQALGPLPAKLPAELFAQKSTFPDVFNPQAIRDPAQHVAQQLTPFGPEYNAATGKPGKPYLGLDSMRNLVTSTQDPGSAAYHNWQAIEDKWRGRMGKPSFASYQRSPKGQALADWSQSLRMGDQSGIEKYKQQYVAAGGDLKSMVASVRALAPLNGLTKDEKAYVLGQLDAREKAVLKKAETYYTEELMKILPPLQRTELMGSLMEHGGLSPAIIPRKTLPPKIPDVLNRVP